MRLPQDLPTNPARLHLQYSYVHGLFDSPQEQTLEHWDISIGHQSEAQETSNVGSMLFYRVRLTQGMNAWTAMAEASEELHRIADVLLDPATGYFTDEVEQRLEYVGTDLLVMNRVTLEPDWRGFGLGPILAAEAINRLSPGIRAVACTPGISAHEEDWRPTRAEFDQVTARIAAGWRTMGFAPYRDHIHLLPMGSTAFEEHTAALHLHLQSLCAGWITSHTA
ncbi:hypothetical protein [Streptomyces sp. NPDC003435]